MYDPDFPSNVDPFGADFEALDLADESQRREARASLSLVDLQDDEESPVAPDLFDTLYADGALR